MADANEQLVWMAFGIAVVVIIFCCVCLSWIYRLTKQKAEIRKFDHASNNNDKKEHGDIDHETNTEKEGSIEALQHYRRTTSMKSVIVKDLELDKEDPDVGIECDDNEADVEGQRAGSD